MSASRRSLDPSLSSSSSPSSAKRSNKTPKRRSSDQELNTVVDESMSRPTLHDADSENKDGSVPLLPQPLSARGERRSCILVGEGSLNFSSQVSTPGDAARIINQEMRSKGFRSRIKVFLAILAVFDFLQVIVSFLLAPPPGMSVEARERYLARTQHKTGLNASYIEGNDAWNLPDPLPGSAHKYVYYSEGVLQLLITIVSVTMLYFSHISRHSDKFPSLTWIPRAPGQQALGDGSGWSPGEIFEFFIWTLHCPIGFAQFNPRWRYINCFCVIRLYTVVQALTEFTEFKSSMVRVMTNFFRLPLTSAVFIRWLLEFHKWKVLIPSICFLWGFLALCFAFAEGVTFGTGLWFIMVTMTTVGYGDITAITTSGRLVALLTMAMGLVVLAYVVAQIQQLTTRPPYEQQVFDALTYAKLSGRARVHAAAVFWYRWRMLRMERMSVPPGDSEVKRTKKLIKEHSQELRRVTRLLRMLPTTGFAGDDATGGSSSSSDNEANNNTNNGGSLGTLSVQMDRLSQRQDAQMKMLVEMVSIVRDLQSSSSKKPSAAAAATAGADSDSATGLVAALREENEMLKRTLADKDREIARLGVMNPGIQE